MSDFCSKNRFCGNNHGDKIRHFVTNLAIFESPFVISWKYEIALIKTILYLNIFFYIFTLDTQFQNMFVVCNFMCRIYALLFKIFVLAYFFALITVLATFSTNWASFFQVFMSNSTFITRKAFLMDQTFWIVSKVCGAYSQNFLNVFLEKFSS